LPKKNKKTIIGQMPEAFNCVKRPQTKIFLKCKQKCKQNLSIFRRIIASGVRRLSRSFYGGSGDSLNQSPRRTGSFAEPTGSGGTGNGSGRQPLRRPHRSHLARKVASQLPHSDGELSDLEQLSSATAAKNTENPAENPSNQQNMTKKLSKINLRKLKIW
jgi:hypothetical protein